MKIDRVTLTGADDNTSRQDLHFLYLHYPFVEFGILFSKSKEETPRYPSNSKIDELLIYEIPYAAHFCGWYSSQILEKRNFDLFKTHSAFSRFQLNYNFGKSTGWDVRPLLEYATKNTETSFILQVNKANQKTIDYVDSIDTPENIHFLYDSSGGRGAEISEIKPIYKNYTGYSGGLHISNIESVVKKIIDYPNPSKVWIDMESGVRTENYFDIEKAAGILEICKSYITP